MDKLKLETLSYHSPLCKCPECGKKPASAPQEGKEKTTLGIEPKTKVENKESVGQPQQPKCKICNGTGHYISEKEYEADCMVCRPPGCSEQPDYSKCRHCGACRVVRPAGEWQFACKCNER